MSTDYARSIEDVSEEESRNWPKGCNRSTHKFMDLEISPIVERKYYNNEEVHEYFSTKRDEYINDGYSVKNAEKQAKIDVMSFIYPLVDLINFGEDNPDITAKCCRLIFQLALERIGSYHIVHGESLKFVNSSISGDKEYDIPDDPSFGWDMTNPSAGFPCINLDANGDCAYHITENKPYRCKQYPINSKEIENISTCSYIFDEDGNRTGICNGCK